MDSLLKPGNANLLYENFFSIYELHLKYKIFLCKGHCVKSAEIRNFLWFASSRIFTNREIFIRSIQIRGNPFQIQENTNQKKTRIQALFRNWEVPDRIQYWLDLRQKKAAKVKSVNTKINQNTSWVFSIELLLELPETFYLTKLRLLLSLFPFVVFPYLRWIFDLRIFMATNNLKYLCITACE